MQSDNIHHDESVLSEDECTSSLHWHLEGSLDDNSGLAIVRITRSPFMIGRAADVDCALPSPNVSKRHAEILIAGDAVFVRDNGSTNGTFVNGTRVHAPTPIGEGDLVQFADKEFRLGCVHKSPHSNTSINHSLSDSWLISRFRQLLNLEQISMHFQPIVSSRNLNPTGIEALARCTVPGFEDPQNLFQSAARLGLEERVSRLCRKKAVEALRESPCCIDLFVNTHPAEHLGQTLLDELAELRELAGGRRIVLELHESAVPDTRTMVEFRAALTDIGVQLAYDDFGSGQSRLLELAKVPPDYLKFDRSLVTDLGQATGGHIVLLQTLVNMAQDAGIATVAEGLDDQESIRVCRELGFSHLQGFAICRPQPVEALNDTWTLEPQAIQKSRS